jgi:endonuclease/exonuclease/phosphatase family metal-dependent hydrolase
MPLTITTWNIQNFSSSDLVFAEKRDFIVATLQALASDVIALQEILDPAALQELADALGFHAHAADPDRRGNRVAFLTREPLVGLLQPIDQWRLPHGVQVQQVGDDGTIENVPVFRRPALQLTVMHDGRPVDVVTAHLKSKLLTFGGRFSTTNERERAHAAFFALQLRSAEATTLREHATAALAAGRDLVMLGDLNDGPETATTQILYGPPGSQPRGPADAARAASAFQRADADDPRRLFNVCNLVPADVRWSRRHNGQNELLDHILVGASMLPRGADGLRQLPTMSIMNADVPDLIGAHPTAGGVVPDHAPVTAAFA